MQKLETARLFLREANLNDAAFIFKLLNSPNWIEHIGDRNILALEDAKKYIRNSLIASYQNNGFGMYIMEMKDTKNAIGICGFLKREELDHVDIGFAILPEFERRGFTFEAAQSVITDSHFKIIYGITSEANQGSQRILQKLGMKYQYNFQFGNYEEESLLFLIENK